MKWRFLRAHLSAVAAAYFVALAILSATMLAGSGDGRAVSFFAFWGIALALLFVPLFALLTLPFSFATDWAFRRANIANAVAYIVAGVAMSYVAMTLLQLSVLIVDIVRSGDGTSPFRDRIGLPGWEFVASIMPAGAVGGWVFWRVRGGKNDRSDSGL